jgi:hypothetical protein
MRSEHSGLCGSAFELEARWHCEVGIFLFFLSGMMMQGMASGGYQRTQAWRSEVDQWTELMTVHREKVGMQKNYRSQNYLAFQKTPWRLKGETWMLAEMLQYRKSPTLLKRDSPVRHEAEQLQKRTVKPGETEGRESRLTTHRKVMEDVVRWVKVSFGVLGFLAQAEVDSCWEGHRNPSDLEVHFGTLGVQMPAV